MTKCLALCIHQRLARAWDVFTHNWHILYADEKSLNPSVKLLCLCIPEGGSGAWHLPEPSRAAVASLQPYTKSPQRRQHATGLIPTTHYIITNTVGHALMDL